MRLELISVRPAPGKRQAFASWAVAQTPKVRTVSPVDFAVPCGLFTAVPEEVLIGARVDGHLYVSPEEDEKNGVSPPGAEIVGVATTQAFTPGAQDGSGAAAIAAVDVARRNAEIAADRGDSSDPSDPGTDYAPLEDAPSDEDDQDDEQPFPCGLCPREFTTERGRDSHRRQVHKEA